MLEQLKKEDLFTKPVLLQGHAWDTIQYLVSQCVPGVVPGDGVDDDDEEEDHYLGNDDDVDDEFEHDDGNIIWDLHLQGKVCQQVDITFVFF